MLEKTKSKCPFKYCEAIFPLHQPTFWEYILNIQHTLKKTPHSFSEIEQDKLRCVTAYLHVENIQKTNRTPQTQNFSVLHHKELILEITLWTLLELNQNTQICVIIKVDPFKQEMWQAPRNSFRYSNVCHNNIYFRLKWAAPVPTYACRRDITLLFPGFPLPQLQVPKLRGGNKLMCCNQAQQRLSVTSYVIKHHACYKSIAWHCVRHLSLRTVKPLLQLFSLLEEFTLPCHSIATCSLLPLWHLMRRFCNLNNEAVTSKTNCKWQRLSQLGLYLEKARWKN